MKTVEEATAEWSVGFQCHRCRTKFEADQDDVELDGFKQSGYYFAGTAVSLDRYFVSCPADRALHFVPDESLPVLLRDRLQAQRRERGW